MSPGGVGRSFTDGWFECWRLQEEIELMCIRRHRQRLLATTTLHMCSWWARACRPPAVKRAYQTHTQLPVLAERWKWSRLEISVSRCLVECAFCVVFKLCQYQGCIKLEHFIAYLKYNELSRILFQLNKQHNFRIKDLHLSTGNLFFFIEMVMF